MQYKTIINKDGFIIHKCVIETNGIVEGYSLQDGEKLVERCNISLIKPYWNGSKWVEGANYDEIQASKNENVIEVRVPNAQDILNAQLLEEIAQQKIVNAQLIQDIATLKGENTNV